MTKRRDVRSTEAPSRPSSWAGRCVSRPAGLHVRVRRSERPVARVSAKLTDSVTFSIFEPDECPRLLIATRFGIGVSDNAWLRHRLQLMTAITAPSLASQTEQRFTWAILVDAALPDDIRQSLEALLAPFQSAWIVDAGEFPFSNRGLVSLTGALETQHRDGWILTGRLDDDDAWHRETVQRLYTELSAWSKSDARSHEGVGATFDHVLEWVMYDIVNVGRLTGGSVSVNYPVMRAVKEPFVGMSVFVLSQADRAVSARVTGHPDMREYLAGHGYDIKVIETQEPACLYARHKQANTAMGKGHRDAIEQDPDLERLTGWFGIDERRTRAYIDNADAVPYAFERYPNHRRRARTKELERIREELEQTDDPRRRAHLHAERRLLRAEADRISTSRVAAFDELMAMRDPNTPLTPAEQVAELRGILAERKRAVAEMQGLLAENELARLNAQEKAARLSRKVEKLREQSTPRRDKLDRVGARDKLFADVARRLPHLSVATVFDVGANVGQTVEKIRAQHPNADIWAFEPVPRAFEVLSAEYGGSARCFNIALGAQAGTSLSRAQGTSSRNRLLARTQEVLRRDTIEVTVVRGDDFCEQHGIDFISYLKTDTEGHDLSVLKGFSSMLDGGRVAIVQIETGMNPDNELHVPFEDVTAYLRSVGFVLMRLYRQVDQGSAGPHLRRADAVYISRQTVSDAVAV